MYFPNRYFPGSGGTILAVVATPGALITLDIGDDLTIDLPTPTDTTSWTLRFRLCKSLKAKTSLVVIEDANIADTNAPLAVITCAASLTASLDPQICFYLLERIDPGHITSLVQGPCDLRRVRPAA